MSTEFEPFHEQLIHHLQEGVCFIDKRLKFTLWNSAAELITGFTSKELIGTACQDSILHQALTTLNKENNNVCPFEQAVTDLKPCAYRLFLQHKQGHHVLINLKVIPLEDNSGLAGTIGVFSDASNQAELEATTRSMQKLMRIDPLTSLPNKRSLFDSMKGEYLRFARYGTPFALIAIAINPPQGEFLPRTGPEREALLKWFAQQLSLGFRKADTPGRLHGASFLALLPHTNTQAAEKAANKLRTMLKATPYPGNGTPVTASFGCASIARSDTLDRLIDRAKSALKMARDNQDNEIVSL